MNPDPWNALRRYTQARIGLGRAAHAVPTAEQLAFQLAHAEARDAIWVSWEVSSFAEKLAAEGIPSELASSAAPDRATYLRRPNLGRRLVSEHARLSVDIALIASNGLSTRAIEAHGVPLLASLHQALRSRGWTLSPVFLVDQGRVALSDPIGEHVGAKVSLMVLGERPGLTSADSLGIYLTYGPGAGRTDADRNCLSNVRPPEGLSIELATAKAVYLVEQSLQQGFSGVALKDDMPQGFLEVAKAPAFSDTASRSTGLHGE